MSEASDRSKPRIKNDRAMTMRAQVLMMILLIIPVAQENASARATSGITYNKQTIRFGMQWTEIAGSFVPGRGTTGIPANYSYLDAAPSIGVWLYRLRQMSSDRSFRFTDPVLVNITTSAVGMGRHRRLLFSRIIPSPACPEGRRSIQRRLFDFKSVRRMMIVK